MQYEELLNLTPPHNSPEFLKFLKKNNTVIFESRFFLGIGNYKYHHHERLPSHVHYTFFLKPPTITPAGYENMIKIHDLYPHLSLYINKADAKSVNRFHFHLVNKGISGMTLFFVHNYRKLDATQRVLYS